MNEQGRKRNTQYERVPYCHEPRLGIQGMMPSKKARFKGWKLVGTLRRMAVDPTQWILATSALVGSKPLVPGLR